MNKYIYQKRNTFVTMKCCFTFTGYYMTIKLRIGFSKYYFIVSNSHQTGSCFITRLLQPPYNFLQFFGVKLLTKFVSLMKQAYPLQITLFRVLNSNFATAKLVSNLHVARDLPKLHHSLPLRAVLSRTLAMVIC